MVHVVDLRGVSAGVEVYINDSTVSGQWVAQALVNGKWDDIRGIDSSPLGAFENWIVSYNSRLTPLQADEAGSEQIKGQAVAFDSMNKEEALSYCYKHRNQYISDLCAAGEDGPEAFDCLIGILEGDTISPSQLPDYGMDYEEA